MKKSRRSESLLLWELTVSVFIILLGANPVRAGSGDLDPTFGDGGKVITQIGDCPYRRMPAGNSPAFLYDRANALTIQRDGKIVTAGYSCRRGSPPYSSADSVNSDYTLARYSPDGGLDSSFDGDGILKTHFVFRPFSSIPMAPDMARSITIQDDGKGDKIVSAGMAGDIGSIDFVMTRYNLDGRLDTDFDGDGTIVARFSGGATDYYFGYTTLAVQEDNKIVAGGTDSPPPGPGFYADHEAGYYPSGGNLVLARYNRIDGSPDVTFGDGGRVTTDLGGSENMYDLKIQDDQKIVVGGTKDGDFLLGRYHPDGSLDGTFGESGVATTNLGRSDVLYSLALQDDGKIVAAGISCQTAFSYTLYNCSIAVARYKTNGELDPDFGEGGRILVSRDGHNIAYRVLIQEDGKILLGGVHNDNPPRTRLTDDDFLLMRINPDGSRDDGSPDDSTPEDRFGASGEVLTDFHGGYDGLLDLKFQSSNKVVAAGYGMDAEGRWGFALTRYLLTDAVADLQVSQTASSTRVLPRGSVTYTLTVTNAGPDAVSEVRLIDSLPSYITVVSLNTSAGSCRQADEVVTCDLGTIEPRTSITISLKIVANLTPSDTVAIMARTLVNTARVSGDAFDPHHENNRSEGRVEVEGVRPSGSSRVILMPLFFWRR